MVIIRRVAQHNRPALRRGVRLSADPLTEDAVLLFPEGILQLNETAARVVACCDGVQTLQQITRTLSDEYLDLVPEEVAAVIDELVREYLMVPDG